MTYEEAINYIHAIPKFVRPLGNADLARLLDKLKNPHRAGRFIHIAGTNGKGSTAAIISSILSAQGYKTGLYTSPFIEVFNERIRINGENISDADLCDITARVKCALEENGLSVSEFAFITAMAFLYFAEQKCDFVVLETGMGGRLDATNIIERPLVSVITSIGLDHMQYLGDTIEEIAAEKCGIIKENCPVVSQSNNDVREIIKSAAAERNAELVFADGEESSDGGFTYKENFYPLALKGDYQKHNGAAAIEVVNVLRKQNIDISEAAVFEGLKNVKWAARFEFVRDNVVIDGAHNIDGIRALKNALAADGRKYGILIAMMSDKSVDECVREIADGAEFVIATEIDMPRCEKAENLAVYAGNITAEADLTKAIDLAIEKIPENGILCVCGSLYFAAEAREYFSVTEYMNEVRKYGSVLGLHNMENLCRALGNPERDLNIIHLAGTNGKGSVGAFVDSILRAAGNNTCRYTSPAVFDYEEIWQYNGENITRGELAQYIKLVKTAADKLVKQGEPHPTAFEIETAIAFLYCRDKKCDYAILETGMGGRLDAVNIIEKSRVSVITSIGIDHTAFLGGTIGEIAREKAGIIKQNGVVVTAPQVEEVAQVIENVCREKHAKLVTAKSPENIRGRIFDYGEIKDIEISLSGAFQPTNAAVAIEVAKELGVSERGIRCGLKNAVWHGRFETICESPRVIIDGAHNVSAAKMLEETIKTELSGQNLNFIIGVLADKDAEKIAEHTAYLADKIYAVTPDNPRAMDKEDLAEILRKYNKNTETTEIAEAVKTAMADKERVTIAFGSLSYLKDVQKAVRNEQGR